MSLQITEALPQFVEHARLSVAELYYEVRDSVPRRPRLSLSRVEAEKCEDEKALRKWARRVVSVRDGFGVSQTTVVGESIWCTSICDYIPAQDEPDAVSWLAERVGITLKWLRESPLWHIRQERSIYEFDCELLWSFCRGHWPVPICGTL